MILLSLASRQIWPHVLSVAHLKPDQLFLLHSDDTSESLPARLTNPLDPAALLACQFGDEVVRFPGERLTLNEKGARVLPQDLAAKLQAETRLDRGALDFRKWLAIEGPSPCPPREGDNLEYATACALLLAGVPAVRRSVELATLPGSPNAEGELDLVSNWNGRLWVVDCKDRDLRLLREDLLQIAEVGGLLGCALAVRSARPPQQAREFTASRQPKVEVLLKSELVKRLPAILAGRRPR
ncbi:MAG: hypothetical protein M5U12_37395 [Verrucomicrobia bacterium]|nr:hypothetical protein [Verrucomicrobiota bacterium]